MKRVGKILLVGNGPYANRGCEALVRSTVDLLAGCRSDLKFIVSSFGGQYALSDAASEHDPRIEHRPHRDDWIRRFSGDWWQFKVFHRWSERWAKAEEFRAEFESLLECDCALLLGGDTYTLDYGVADFTLMTELCDALMATGRPVVMWCASVGPFDADPAAAEVARRQLSELDLVLVRESETLKYLQGFGIDGNVKLVSDPAFTMNPEEPALTQELRAFIDRGAIGLNLSPLAGHYRGGGADDWPEQAAQCVRAVVESDLPPLLLVPHVMIDGQSDHAFLSAAADAAKAAGDRLAILPPDLTARHYKWVLSRLRAFAGARTHATIGALSSGVPTVCIGYSVKARGISKDLFGTEDYLLPVDRLSPSSLVAAFERLLQSESQIRSKLAESVPVMQERARDAARHVVELIER